MILPANNHPINCGTANTTFTRVFEKRPISKRSFDLVATESRRVVAPSGTFSILVDKNNNTVGTPLKAITRNTNGNYVTDYSVGVNIRASGYFLPISIISESPSILSNPTSNSIATHQSNGECIFRATSIDGETTLLKVNATTSSPTNVDTFQYWVSGSLARHCTDQINNLILTKTELNVFNAPYNQSNLIRNTNCWANGVDLSCASPWNSTGMNTMAGTLVSPRHVLFCKHSSFYPKAGATIYFVTPNNTVVTRTISATTTVFGADIAIGLLDSEVPTGITFAKVLPTNYLQYLPGIDRISYVPVLSLNQNERATIAGLHLLSGFFYNAFAFNHSNYTGSIVLGDSGNPTFLIINGEPILIGVFTWGTYGGGDNVGHSINSVNSAMTSLGGGYQLTEVDLSSFNSY